MVGKAISVSRKQQERTAGWVAHREPLVIRTGTSSESWTLIRGTGCFGLWRGQGSAAESDHEVAGEKESAGFGDKKGSREWVKAGVLCSPMELCCAAWGKCLLSDQPSGVMETFPLFTEFTSKPFCGCRDLLSWWHTACWGLVALNRARGLLAAS